MIYFHFPVVMFFHVLLTCRGVWTISEIIFGNLPVSNCDDIGMEILSGRIFPWQGGRPHKVKLILGQNQDKKWLNAAHFRGSTFSLHRHSQFAFISDVNLQLPSNTVYLRAIQLNLKKFVARHNKQRHRKEQLRSFSLKGENQNLTFV